MPELRLLDEQRPPIERHDEHCLLSAGAGSGKTRVLVERYLRILAAGDWSPRLPGRILAITFTEKAAQEMRERVLDRLGERARAARGDERSRLHALLREMESAPVGTIHGFCSRLLKEQAVAAGLDPRFTVPSEIDLALLRRRALDALLREPDADLELLLEHFSLDGLAAGIGRLRELRRSLGLDPAELEGERADALAAEQQAFLREHFVAALIAAQGELAADFAALAAALEPGGHPAQGSREKLDAARALLAAADLAQPAPALPGALKAAMSRFQKKGAKLPAELPDLVARYEASRARCADLAGSASAADPAGEEAARFAALGAACFRLTGRYDAQLRRRLRARGWLDFEDLQLEAVDLLRRDAGVRRRVQRAYDHVLVDEFQDTNRLQLELLRLLVPLDTPSAERALFLVGDERQSIYAFRNADVAVFHAERERLAAQRRAHGLAYNHRSRADLLAFFNAFFRPPVFPGMESLEPREKRPRALLQLQPRIEREDELADMRLEAARALVRRLADAHARGLAVGRPGEERPVAWGDMAILVRSGASVRALTRALGEAGVPYDADAGREYFLRRELVDLEALLAALDDPYQPFTLVRGLRGDLIGIDRADLLALLPPPRERRGEEGPLGDRDRGELLARLERGAAGELGLSEDGRRRLARFLDLRRRFAGRLRRLPLRELVPEVIAAVDFDLRAAVDPRGLKVLRNLRQLADFLGELESGRRLGLREFLDSMESLREHSPRQQEAWVPEEGGSLLRILTIHGAKGLEFPVVALFDLERELVPRGGGELGALRADLPRRPAALLGLRPNDPRRPAERGSGDAAFAWIAAERRRREEAENLRLLYVAMTRAADYLLLSGTFGLKADAPLLETFLAEAPAEAKSFLDLLRAFLAAGEGDGLLRVVAAEDAEGLDGPVLQRDPDAAPAAAFAPDYERLLVPPPPEDRPLELPVTSLTLLGSCPLRWLLDRRLGLGHLFRADGEPWVPRERERLEREGSGGAELGSALHAILERWDFRAEFDAAFAAACPAGLDPRLVLDARELLQGFFAGRQPWLQRLAEAENLRAEEPFVYRAEELLLHGQTDLVFEWRGQRILLDWKSDRIAGRERMERRVGHHRFQILLYALALAAAGRPLDQALVVFLRAGEEGGFRQVRLEHADLEWAVNRARGLARIARRLSALEPPAAGGSLIDAVPIHKDPPCQDCPFRDGPCPRGYRQAAHGLR